MRWTRTGKPRRGWSRTQALAQVLLVVSVWALVVALLMHAN
ncbi:hypothetical protein [Streptomyces sp. NPDC094049]